MPTGGGARASQGSAEAIHSRPTGGAAQSHWEPDRAAATIEVVHVTWPEPLEGRRADREERANLRSLHTTWEPASTEL